jgi:predicted ester cyclase
MTSAPPLTRRSVIASGAAATGAASLLTGGPLAAAQRSRPTRTAASRHAENKRLLAAFLTEMASGDARAVLGRYCHPDCRFEIFHPFNTIDGLDAAAEKFWLPLRAAFPDYEQRIAFLVGGEYEGRAMASSWGHAMGTFDAPWLGIPPTRGLAFLSFGCNVIVRDGKISKAYILLDIVDLMRQAGFYPFRPMPGTGEAWPFPPCDTGATAFGHDPVRGAETLRIVREMQVGLPNQAQIKSTNAQPAPHSPHWHENMNWYGPAGIGSMRGLRGFRNFHGALFLQAFPDRTGWQRDPNGPQDAPGHYIRLGDGRYAVTSGYPSLNATHTGAEWLGLPPSGRRIEMRVADWYRLDAENKIVDNWVMMDIPHIVSQMGMDLFHDLEFRVDPSKYRTRLAP